MSDALAMELEATRCRLEQALRMHNEYRELTDLQRARIQYLEAGKETPSVSHGDPKNAPGRRDETATEVTHADHVTPAPVRPFRQHDYVGAGGAVPTDEARRAQRLCQNPLCTVSPTPGRAYCSGGCATKHRWAETKRLRKSGSAPSDFRRIPPGSSIPIDRDRQHENLCQNPTCEGAAGASGRYCSYSCAATHRNAVRREQLAAAREVLPTMERAPVPAGTGEILPDQGPSEPRAAMRVQPAPPPPADETLRDMERALIVKTLARFHDNRTHAASALGISIRTLRNKIREYRQLGDAC
ncbi:MAG: hypothetical protein NTAFB01_13190 [Nitrospira sp.]